VKMPLYIFHIRTTIHQLHSPAFNVIHHFAATGTDTLIIGITLQNHRRQVTGTYDFFHFLRLTGCLGQIMLIIKAGAQQFLKIYSAIVTLVLGQHRRHISPALYYLHRLAINKVQRFTAFRAYKVIGRIFL